jgi:hypothetical protein
MPVLSKLYTPKLKLNDFVLKVLKQYPKLQLKNIEEFWKTKNFRATKDVLKDKPEKTATERIAGLDKEQTEALSDLFYRQHKGSIGVRALFELLKQDPRQIAELERTNNKFGWINWRSLRAWYNGQESVQLHRRAKPKSKTLVNVPREDTLQPFAIMQLDTIEMAQGVRNTDPAYTPNDTSDNMRDKRGLPSGGKRKVFHLIDLATNDSFLGASDVLAQDSAIAVYSEFLYAIYEHFGRWPVEETVISTDDGKEHKSKFRHAMENLLVPGSTTETLPIKIKVNRAFSVNDQAVVEGANGVFRRLAKRYAENTKSKRNPNANYLGFWYGKGGEILRELNFLMNTRPVSSLGYQTPADVLKAGSIPPMMTIPAANEPSRPLPSSVSSSPTLTLRLRASTLPMIASCA